MASVGNDSEQARQAQDVRLVVGREKEKLAKDLGAHVYIDTVAEDPAAVLQRMGGAVRLIRVCANQTGSAE
jgi:NADPH:quinone reductase-like Zn-dependent oxidoreductase